MSIRDAMWTLGNFFKNENDELEDEYYDDDEYEAEAPVYARAERRSSESRSYAPEEEAVDLQTDVLSVTLTSMDDASHVCRYLRRECLCIIRLNTEDSRVSQRIVDFINGSAYSQSYQVESVNREILILVPAEMNINSSLQPKKPSRFYHGKRETRQ